MTTAAKTYTTTEQGAVTSVKLELKVEDVQVLTDLALSIGMRPLASRLIASLQPRCRWTKIGHKGPWHIRCPRDVSDGDVLFVQARTTGRVSEVQVGEVVEDNPKSPYVIRAVKRSEKLEL